MIKQLPKKPGVAEVPVTISEELPVVSIHCKPVPNVFLAKIHDQESSGIYKRIAAKDIDIEE